MEKKERMPETPAEEKKESHSAETKPVPLLMKEALRMVHSILGCSSHSKRWPEIWDVLKNRLKDEVRPVSAENKRLLAVIDDLEAERRLRRERYEARPKCAKCGGARGRLMYFVTPKGGIELYHPGQCGEDRKLTPSFETAKIIAEKQKQKVEYDKFRGEDFIKAVKDGVEILKVQDGMKAENQKSVRKITAGKDALKVKGQIAAAEISARKKNPHQSAMGKAMTEAVAKKK